MTDTSNHRRSKWRGHNNSSGHKNTDPGAGQRHPSKVADWQRNYDHYCELARNQTSGDLVTRERYWQHAEHFCRLMNGSSTL
jgi:hypothetical protein